MRVLLDTNIIIYRENKKMTNYDIGHLFRWLDRLKCDKLIHPLSRGEIARYKNDDPKESMTLKLDAYEEMRTVAPLGKEVEALALKTDKTENDTVDTALLNEVFLGRVDLLITEDKRLIQKAHQLGLNDKVLSINAFISYATSENPELIEYGALAVKKERMGNVDIGDEFFDSLRETYGVVDFNRWFAKKCDEEAYTCRDDVGHILGFLYLKTEAIDESYSDITPPFAPKKRLKVGTFKVNATGFRLGERFIKIIFDNALERNVDEIYVTLYKGREELEALSDMLSQWGFKQHGIKISTGEEVLVKTVKSFDAGLSPRQNYPNLSYNHQKFILPIEPQYHTSLLPDSILNTENEVSFIGKEPHRYALEKVYISWAPERNIKRGDIVLFYRKGEEGSNKRYSSVISTVGIVEEMIDSFSSKEDYLMHCQNRSVFSRQELEGFWQKDRFNLKVLRFIFVKSLVKRPILGFLWENDIVQAPGGPRPFTRISDCQFETIMREAETDLSKHWR